MQRDDEYLKRTNKDVVWCHSPSGDRTIVERIMKANNKEMKYGTISPTFFV